MDNKNRHALVVRTGWAFVDQVNKDNELVEALHSLLHESDLRKVVDVVNRRHQVLKQELLSEINTNV